VTTPPSPLTVLDVTTDQAAAAVVKIDGIAYPLRRPATLRITEHNALILEGHRIATLTEHGDGAEQAAELEQLLERVVARVLPAPADVLAKLTDVQRFQIAIAYGTQGDPWANVLGSDQQPTAQSAEHQSGLRDQVSADQATRGRS
jgi:hypothetical protein